MNLPGIRGWFYTTNSRFLVFFCRWSAFERLPMTRRRPIQGTLLATYILASIACASSSPSAARCCDPLLHVYQYEESYICTALSIKLPIKVWLRQTLWTWRSAPLSTPSPRGWLLPLPLRYVSLVRDMKYGRETIECCRTSDGHTLIREDIGRRTALIFIGKEEYRYWKYEEQWSKWSWWRYRQ